MLKILDSNIMVSIINSRRDGVAKIMRYKIKEYREKKGYSVSKLATMVGISRVYMSQIENGKVDNISTKLLVAIAKCLDRKVEDILFLE